MMRASTAARLPENQNSAYAQNQAAETEAVLATVQKVAQTAAQETSQATAQTATQTAVQNADICTHPMQNVYDGGITEEIVHGYVDTPLNYKYASNRGSYPTSDGRYVYTVVTGSGKNYHTEKHVLSNVPPELFGFFVKTDRYDNNCQRKMMEHADYSTRYADGGEDENGDYHQSAMDRAAYQQWLWKESRDETQDDPIYPDEMLKQDFVPGESKVNNQRCRMRLQVIKQFMGNVSRKDMETINKYYCMRMTEEQIAAEEGVEKQAICNRITRIKAALRQVFIKLDIPVPTDAELEDERKKRKAREDAIREAEKARKEEKAEMRAIREEVNREYRTEIEKVTEEGTEE